MIGVVGPRSFFLRAFCLHILYLFACDWGGVINTFFHLGLHVRLTVRAAMVIISHSQIVLEGKERKSLLFALLSANSMYVHMWGWRRSLNESLTPLSKTQDRTVECSLPFCSPNATSKLHREMPMAAISVVGGPASSERMARCLSLHLGQEEVGNCSVNVGCSLVSM